MELRKAREKIKDLEKEKLKSKGSGVKEPVANKKEFPQEDTLDLEMLVNVPLQTCKSTLRKTENKVGL